MKRELLLALIAIVVCSLTVAGTVQAETYKWRLATITPPTSAFGQGLTSFAEKVDKKTKGQMKIQIGFSSAFGGYTEAMKLVSMGSIEMMVEAVESYEPLDKNLRICRLPYTFSGWDHYGAWIKSPLFENVVKTLSASNHQVFTPNEKGAWRRGPYRVIVSKRPIFKVSDLQDLKLRMYESEIGKKVWSQMGCKINVIAWGETYLALKQGMVEAVTSAMDMVYDMKFHEAAPYITNINEFLQNNMMTTDKRKWDKLPENIRRAMTDAINEVAVLSNSQLDNRVENDTQKMLDEGAFFIRAGLNGFKEKVAPLVKEFESQGMWDKGLFEEIQKLKP